MKNQKSKKSFLQRIVAPFKIKEIFFKLKLLIIELFRNKNYNRHRSGINSPVRGIKMESGICGKSPENTIQKLLFPQVSQPKSVLYSKSSLFD